MLLKCGHVETVLILALPWKQLVSIGGIDGASDLANNILNLDNKVKILNLFDANYEECHGIPQLPLPVLNSKVERIHSKILSCGGLIQFEGFNLPQASDRCFVFDR